MNNLDCLIFLHIPKNAGSSTHSIFGKVYENKGVQNLFGSMYSDKEIHSFIEKNHLEKENITLLKGHMPFGLHEYMSQKSKYFTIIREPVSRLISQYNYILRNDDNPHHERIINENLTIFDVIDKKIAKGFDNAQCRFLTNRFDCPVGELPDDTYDLAIDNLNTHFLFYGLTDKFDLSMLILSQLLGWKNLPFYRRENTHKNKKNDYNVTSQDIEMIKEKNSLDIKLYEYASKKFDEVVKSKPGIMDELKRYQKYNAWYQKLTYPLSFLPRL